MPQPRQEILNHPDALDCTVYRPDEQDRDAEEQDLGDGKVLITGAFEPPQDWDAHQREDYYGEEDPTHFGISSCPRAVTTWPCSPAWAKW